MSNTVEGLTGSEICRIIGACSKSGVSSFSHGDLRIDFGSRGGLAMIEGASANPIAGSGQNDTMVKELAMSESDKEFIGALEDHQMMMDDPEGFEQGIIDSHMRGGKDARDERVENIGFERDLS